MCNVHTSRSIVIVDLQISNMGIKPQDYEIDLQIEVNESEVKRYAYTPREKYDKLNEINPNLDSLRKEFDLDI